MTENERTLSSPPSDGVSALRFTADGGSLLASSWDKALRLYDVQTDRVRATLLLPSSLLDCDLLPDGQHAVSAGLDGRVNGVVGQVEAEGFVLMATYKVERAIRQDTSRCSRQASSIPCSGPRRTTTRT